MHTFNQIAKMKKIIYILLICFSLQLNSQNKNKAYVFGQVSNEELEMKLYEKDTTANAVVLFEHGYTFVESKLDQFNLKTAVYGKIKIFNKEGEKHATVKIVIYNNENKSAEKVVHIKATTYNLDEPNTSLNTEHVYTNILSENLKEVTFTFPNVKPGSVLEYQYDIESDYFFNFSGWTFQSDIPKIQSEFHALIPANWRYNRQLKGSLKLTTNEAEIKKKCIIFTSRKHADCEKLTYIMKDIPAFIEEEKYSTTKNNYISKIKFELAEFTFLDGTSKKFTASWKEADKILKYDESIGAQLKSNTFFSKYLPQNILNNEDDLMKSKSIYKYIQDHFSLNEDKTNIFSEVDVKKAFKEGLGSASEINLALISALKMAEIDAEIILLSTRDRGFPTKLHPILTDFNYLAAHVTLNNKTYLLDASDKFLSFNMLPFKALNSYGRVLDFENGSYWFSTEPKVKTFETVKATLKMNDDGTLFGSVQETNNGYFSKFKRELIHDKREETYLIDLENKNENLEILSYSNEELEKPENPFVENFEIEIVAAESFGNTVYLNPFIQKYVKNPFQLNQRTYPVNFGYKIKELYMAKINIPKNYIIKTIPKSTAFKLPDKGGLFTVNFQKEENIITIITRIQLNKTIYETDEYENLKEFFNQIIKTQNSLITLEKTIAP